MSTLSYCNAATVGSQDVSVLVWESWSWVLVWSVKYRANRSVGSHRFKACPDILVRARRRWLLIFESRYWRLLHRKAVGKASMNSLTLRARRTKHSWATHWHLASYELVAPCPKVKAPRWERFQSFVLCFHDKMEKSSAQRGACVRKCVACLCSCHSASWPSLEGSHASHNQASTT